VSSGLVIAGVAMVIAWRRSRVDFVGAALLTVAVAGVLAYVYRSLGG
jgi:hypothetical protein